MNKKTVKDIDLKDKKVLVRCDFNVPMDENKNITDNRRIVAALPTIKYLLEQNCKIVLCSHLGRPKGEFKPEFSLAPVAKELSKQLNMDVVMAKDVIGEDATNKAEKLKNGEILLLENLRFHREETDNDPEFAKKLASYGEVFVNDAFGTLHRAHASNVGIAKLLPSCIGFLVEKEIKMLDILLNDIKRPYTVILGGAKMNDKISIIDSLIKKCDYILLGGGIANTFLTAKGYDLKDSVYDEESLKHCIELLNKYEDKIVLPVDGLASSSYNDGLLVKYYRLDNVENGNMILDIGNDTIKLFEKYLKSSKTVFWNGPVGVSEFKNFETGTKSLCKILSKKDAKIIIGGGDTAAAAIKFGYKNKFTHISTGGGASLEYIEGKKLPGLEFIGEK